MARALSNEKRNTIVETAKRLFAEQGFAATSVADIARVAELPVGSIYTYFSSKEELIRSIVDEGWADFRGRLQESFATTRSPEEIFGLLLDTFLPELLADLDFITILLNEGIVYTHIEEKAQELSSLISSVFAPITRQAPSLKDFTGTDMEAALLVYFLGVLGAVRVAKAANLSVTSSDVLAFLRLSIRNGLGIAI
ncbi:MAG: TetR/AcrR family transcriptional regulator [Spirochaetales bacterium]|nr:TetR/AcrR family transcriptional regulator [Spirochaetales bacterium]